MKRFLLLGLLALMPSVLGAQGVRSFTDDDYRKVLRAESRVLFYSFSPSMPLSIDGLKEIRRAAEDLKAHLVILADPSIPEREILALRDSQVLFQKSNELRKKGIQLHYPSLVVSDKHRAVGAPIAGFKSRAAYVTLVSDLLKLRWTTEFRATEQIPLPRSMSLFFKPVYGTDLIVSGSAGPNFLLNVQTRDVVDIKVNGGDPGASPDGVFITLLGFDGLRWFSTADIFANQIQLLLHDTGLKTYQSMGQLSDSNHRVLGSLSSSANPAGLIFRDYERRARDRGGVWTIAPLTEWRAVCAGKAIAIPMMSKTGRLLSGSHQGTLRVFRIGPNATECEEVFDSKVVAGKADFSRDDRHVIYVAPSQDPGSRATVDTVFLADLSTGQAKAIYYAPEKVQLAFPGFMNPDRIVVYEQPSKQLIVLDRTRVIQD